LFQAKTDQEVVAQIRADTVPPVGERRGDLPAAISAIVARALSADPADRFASARAMANELNAVVRSDGPSGDADEIVAKAVSDSVDARRGAK
jgi:hypothetical protein